MRVLAVTFFLVLADQLTKLMVKGITIPWLGVNFRGFPLGYSKPVLGDFIKLTYIENPGMAFGIDLGGKVFFSLVSIVASIGILIYLYKMRNEPIWYRLSLSMILGGAIGNLIDRTFYGVIFNEAPLFHGRVVDFIDVDFFDLNLFGYHLNRWPVFNIADAAVTCGVVLLLLSHRTVTQVSDAPQGSGDPGGDPYQQHGDGMPVPVPVQTTPPSTPSSHSGAEPTAQA